MRHHRELEEILATAGDKEFKALFDGAFEELEEIPDEVHENIATTQAEYLTIAYDRAEVGFDTLTAASGHATDALMVKNAYEGTSGC